MKRILLFYLIGISCTGCFKRPPIPVYYKVPVEEMRFSQALDRVVKLDSLDLELLEWAIFNETNIQRTRLGRLPLAFEFKLQQGARKHSEEMNALGYFDHTSPVETNRTIKQRLKNSGIRYGVGGENIAIHPAVKKQEVEFRVAQSTNSTRYLWRNAGWGYTYQEFAKDLVRRWLNSRSHRFNILHASFHFLGVGVAPGRYDEKEVFYVTQNFSSTNY